MRGGSLGNHVQELINEGQGTERCISQDWPDLPPFIISEAPKNMRLLHPQAFEPTLVSIGPVHHSDEGLLPMIQVKLRFYLRLSEQLYGSRDIDNEIKRKADNLAHKAKSCYPHTFGMTDSDFGLMLALDACFILELFRYAEQGIVVDDPIFRTRWMLPAIGLDLIKFGNQLPFFVLESLYDLTSSGNESQPPLTELAAKFLADLIPDAHEWRSCDNKPAHLLALFHSTFSPMSNNYSVHVSDTNLPWDGRCLVMGAKELWNHGILLKKGNHGLLNINFDPNTRVFEIPSLVINHDTVSIFRNLVAYEQCNRSVPSYFSYYIAFLAGLVHSPEDVELLCGKGILNHTLATQEQVVAELNTLSMGVAYEEQHNFHLHKVIRDIDMYTRRRWHKWEAELRRDYFSRPEATLTVLGLYLAVIQTVFGVLSYATPKR